MVNRKSLRTRGKIRFSEKFKILENGQRVAVVLEQSSPVEIPKRMQGRTGIVLERRGSQYIVEICDQKKPKKYIIDPVHLKRIMGDKK
jgi:ribosomal protein L21E